MTHRQLQPGEPVRVIVDGVASRATVDRTLDDGFLYYRFFANGYDHHANRVDVFAADEDSRLIERLREIRREALNSIRRIEAKRKQPASA